MNDNRNVNNDNNEYTQRIDYNDENEYTQGVQGYYTEALRNIKGNRHSTYNANVLSNVDNIRRQIVDRYGFESKEYRKFTEKIRKLQEIQETNLSLKNNNNKKKKIIFILCVVTALCIASAIMLFLNSDTYYVNQGQFNTIYKRSLTGTVECFKSVSVRNLEKKGSYLYYIDLADDKICRTSTKNGAEDKVISGYKASVFKIVDEYLYYINIDDGNKLYRVNTDGENESCVYDGGCLNISTNKGDVEFVVNDGSNLTKILDTDDLSIRDNVIN